MWRRWWQVPGRTPQQRARTGARWLIVAVVLSALLLLVAGLLNGGLERSDRGIAGPQVPWFGDESPPAGRDEGEVAREGR